MDQDSPAESSRLRRADIAAALACALFGVVFSILPHLVWWAEIGEPVYIADNDNLDLHLTAASQAYFGHPTHITDTVRDQGPSYFPNYQFVPGVLFARLLRWGPLGVNLVWRIWAGLSIGLGWYLVTRQVTGRTFWALGISLLLIADRGVIGGKPLILHAGAFWRVISGRAGDLFDRGPLMHQWRLITPGLSLATLLVFLWLLCRARDRPTQARSLAAGVGLGLLFHAYFYYWTAAIPALGICWLLDSRRRKVYFHTSWIGVLIGLPAILAGRAVKASTNPDWLPRNDFFVPIARFSEFAIPVGSAILVAAAFPWVWLKRRDLLVFWAMAAAALLLMNHQVLTGLYIQNHHWAAFVLGPMLSVLLLFIGADVLGRFGVGRSRVAQAVIGLLLAAHVGFGLWLRMGESRASYTMRMMNGYRDYKSQRSQPDAPRLEPARAVAGDPLFVDLAVVLDREWPLSEYAVVNSSQVDNNEWDEREALNAVLRGVSRSAFEVETTTLLDNGWGPWRHDRDLAAREERSKKRLAAFDRISKNPNDYRRRYNVGYVALPSADRAPRVLEDEAWIRLQSGPRWQIWGAPTDR
jgi:hypothetical protein